MHGYAQPAVVSVKGYCQSACRVGVKEVRGTKTTQVNARMATAEYDRQGQAAHRQYKSRTVIGSLQVSPCLIDTHKREKFSS